MEQIRSDNLEGLADESSEQLMDSPSSSYLNGLYGEQDVLPRVGDQYQAEIPDLIPEDDRLKLINVSESKPHPQNPFSLLPIQLMWTGSEKFRGFCETNGNYVPNDDDPLAKADPAAGSKVRTIVLALPCQKNVKFKFDCLGKSLNPFPGSLGESWEDLEQKRSSEYRRWADGRRLRSRRSIQCHKLLTGWRQQELLSRISSHVSEECKSTLLEVSKAFREEKIALEEYVFTLKSSVGTDILIEAIGIGKGKKDLTNGAVEPPKTNLANSGNSEVPTGRACSSLSPADIVRYLTGGFRLSKARSSDLFWEAVWPRLLARGWHSEQPRDHQVRNSLVFLIPGAKKFSRRRMVKGNHYFDSVTDVLNKVALDPTLLEFDAEAIRENWNIEDRDGNEQLVNSDEFDDSSPDSKRQRYLQPQKSSKNLDVMMFTIVDTSTTHGVERRMSREMRCLPVETGGSSTFSPSFSSQSEDNSSEYMENKAERKAKSTTVRECSDSLVHASGARLSSCKTSSLNMSTDNVLSQCSVFPSESHQKKNRKVKPKDPNRLSFVGKRSSLAAWTIGELGYCDETPSRKKKSKTKETDMGPKSRNTHQDVVMREEDRDQPHKLSSANSLAGDSSNGRNELSLEKPETHEHFEMNNSQLQVEGEAEVVQNNESSWTEHSSIKLNVELPNGEESAYQQPGRRQSTRSRPLTAKALEAFAFGFLGSSKKKRKEPEEDSRYRSRTKSSKHKHDHMVVTAEFRNGMTNNDFSNTDENG
ncbi:PREDICTED: uncharacterized protein LOC104801626 isoform X3 [Tarenaya hassleriana]|uniref:uncharacterized protein LOC104801626 isoform X3 n=1 Tax=Tarenaya hassleriana TaxID=28532 RepID=UPI00053C55DB|nr:PREDICTED: uncharacterized protein LOC104801626 isoform X3 [Tarenaya hassleriana]